MTKAQQKIKNAITDTLAASGRHEKSRQVLIDFIKSHPMTTRQKAILFGWGPGNYTNRMRQNISDTRLIAAVEKLMEVGE